MKKLNNMKKLILILIIGVSISACGAETKETQVDSLKAVERDAKDNDEYKEVEVENNSTDDAIDSNDDQGDTIGDSSVIGDESSDIESSDIESSEDEKMESDVNQDEINSPVLEEPLLEVNEYSVIDLNEPDDLTNYVTGLVFILKEGDIWRVVDRLGSVYRISTSREGIVQGIVNNEAAVTMDSEEKVQVSLGKDYTSYENSYILTASLEDVAKEFSDKLLSNQMKSDDKSKISSYTLNSATITEKKGKGIIAIKMNFDVKPNVNATLWGDTDANGLVTDIDYVYTLYGYDDTWVLPIKKPLYLDLVTGDATTGNSDSNNSVTTVSNADDAKKNDDNGGNLNSFVADENQIVLSGIDETYLYMEKESLSDNEYEMKLYMYNSSTLNIIRVADGFKNGYYEVITSFDDQVYLYLYEMYQSKDSISGVAVVDMVKNTYRNLYIGRIEKGITINNKSYVFTNDNLIEINLKTKSLRIAAVLPKHLEFDKNSVKVIDVTGGTMDIEISYEEESVTYSVDLATGEMIITGNFKY